MVDSRNIHIHPGGRWIIYDILGCGRCAGDMRIKRRQVEADGVNATGGNLIASEGYSCTRIFDHDLHAGLWINNSIKVSRELLGGWNGRRKRVCDARSN